MGRFRLRTYWSLVFWVQFVFSTCFFLNFFLSFCVFWLALVSWGVLTVVSGRLATLCLPVLVVLPSNLSYLLARACSFLCVHSSFTSKLISAWCPTLRHHQCSRVRGTVILP